MYLKVLFTGTLKILIHKLCMWITHLKSQPYLLPGDNELNSMHKNIYLPAMKWFVCKWLASVLTAWLNLANILVCLCLFWHRRKPVDGKWRSNMAIVNQNIWHKEQGTLLLAGLSLILAWISNCIDYKSWDEITNPFPNLNGKADEVWE